MEHLRFDLSGATRRRAAPMWAWSAPAIWKSCWNPRPTAQAHVVVNTSVEGFGAVWKIVLDRFFSALQRRSHDRNQRLWRDARAR